MSYILSCPSHAAAAAADSRQPQQRRGGGDAAELQDLKSGVVDEDNPAAADRAKQKGERQAAAAKRCALRGGTTRYPE